MGETAPVGANLENLPGYLEIETVNFYNSAGTFSGWIGLEIKNSNRKNHTLQSRNWKTRNWMQRSSFRPRKVNYQEILDSNIVQFVSLEEDKQAGNQTYDEQHEASCSDRYTNSCHYHGQQA